MAFSGHALATLLVFIPVILDAASSEPILKSSFAVQAICCSTEGPQFLPRVPTHDESFLRLGILHMHSVVSVLT